MKKINFMVLLFIFPVLSLSAQSGATTSYWDEVDFNDTTLISSKTLTDNLVSYLYGFTDGDEHRFDSLSIAGLDTILGKAKVNMSMYEFILEFALDGYTAMGRSAVTDHLLNYPQLGENDITMEEGLRLDSITERFQKVKVGAKAPDIEFTSIDGKPYHLSSSEADRIIVFFWSTDCEYCHDFLVQMRKNLDLKSDFELVTFALAEDQEEAEAAVKKMRLPGYHFYDSLRWESKPFLDYHITSTPTAFVLDKEKTIVCKPYDWFELKEWLKQNR